MRPFERLDEGEKQIVRYQVKQYYAHARLFHAEVIPSIPTDEADEGEIIPRAPATMTQQENGWGYNEREFIGEDMPRQPALRSPIPAHKKERKQKKRGAVRVGPRVRHQAQAPVTIGAAEIVAKKRPEIRGK
jgi:hypothetical protein